MNVTGAVELASLVIVGVWVVARWRQTHALSTLLVRLLLLAAGGAVAENTVIAVYGFYAYSPTWSVFVGHVPLLVVLIWPVVIDSAMQIARRLAAHPATSALIAAGIVLTDASLIEPIAVAAGLWHWSEPGLFHVPPIGILGWAMFTLAASWCLSEGRRSWVRWAVPILAPLFTHLALLGAWWTLFRWVNTSVPEGWAIAVAWVANIALVLVMVHTRSAERVPRSLAMLRAPGALVFFVLLVVVWRAEPSLLAWAPAFGLPWCVGLLLPRAGETS